VFCIPMLNHNGRQTGSKISACARPTYKAFPTLPQMQSPWQSCRLLFCCRPGGGTSDAEGGMGGGPAEGFFGARVVDPREGGNGGFNYERIGGFAGKLNQGRDGATFPALTENPRGPNRRGRFGMAQGRNEFLHEIGAGLPGENVIATARTNLGCRHHFGPTVGAIEGHDVPSSAMRRSISSNDVDRCPPKTYLPVEACRHSFINR